MTRSNLEHITATNVEGREITLTLDEMLGVYQQAWWCHRVRPGQQPLVGLRANLVARILGRKAHHDGKHVYVADADTYEITCGQ